jgi:hypothetical protein
MACVPSVRLISPDNPECPWRKVGRLEECKDGNIYREKLDVEGDWSSPGTKQFLALVFLLGCPSRCSSSWPIHMNFYFQELYFLPLGMVMHFC